MQKIRNANPQNAESKIDVEIHSHLIQTYTMESQKTDSKPIDSISTQSNSTESKLANFPVALFASVMGTGSLSLVLKKMSIIVGSLPNANIIESTLESNTSWQSIIAPLLWWSAYGFAVLAVIVFTLLLVCYGAKIFFHFNSFKADLKHQVKINFLSSIPISMLIIAAFWGDVGVGSDVFWYGVLGLFYIASALQLVLSLYVMSFWFRESMKSTLLSPAWFIPIVGNLVVPLSGSLIFASKDLLLFFFSVGCFFWIILGAMIMQRLIFDQSLDSKSIPTLFIFIAPPSIFTIDLHCLFESHSTLSLISFNVALFFVLLLVSLGKIFTKLSFAPSWWAFTFPLCAFSLAGFVLYVDYGFKWFYGVLGILGFMMAFFAVTFTSYKTLKAILDGTIFRE